MIFSKNPHLLNCPNFKIKICRWGQLIFLSAAVLLFLIGAAVSPVSRPCFGFVAFGGLFVWISGLFFSTEKLKDRFLLLAFQCVIFVFLLCRPILNIFMGRKWYQYFNADTIWFSFSSISCSLIMLALGSFFAEHCYDKRSAKNKSPRLAPGRQDPEDFRLVSLLAYLFCMIFFLIGEMDKLIFMHNRNYQEFYTGYHSQLPFFVGTFAAMMPFSMAIYLSTLPRKKSAFCVLLLYILSALPQFLIGIRNPLVLHCLLALFYYILRDTMGDSEIWFGKWEKRLLLLVVPAGTLVLSSLNYIRLGDKQASSGIFSSIIDLFYKQGVTFNTLSDGYTVMYDLPVGDKCFTLGPFIDYLQRNRIGCMLLGLTPFPHGNSVSHALYGNNLSHTLSYTLLSDYLEGHGTGSCYILELYIDFGFPGILIGNLLLGFGLTSMIREFSESWLSRTIILICLTGLFFIPRAEATGWLLFLIQPHFWLITGACIIGAKLFKKLAVRNFCRRFYPVHQ